MALRFSIYRSLKVTSDKPVLQRYFKIYFMDISFEVNL